MTSGELAIARATRSASAARGGAVDLDPPDPRGALAVGDDLERELQQHRLEQALGQRLRPAAPVACSSTVSLVLICPSTVIRSKEASTAARRAASGSSTTASVWTKQSIVAKPGSIIPAALGLGGEGHAAGPQRAALRPAVGGQDRVGEGGAAARARGSPAASPMPAEHRVDRQRHPDHAGLGDGDGLRPQAELRRRLVAHRHRVGVALLAGLGVGVAGVDDGGADRALLAALPADPHRRRRRGVAGEQDRRGDLARRRRRAGRRRSCRRP